MYRELRGGLASLLCGGALLCSVGSAEADLPGVVLRSGGASADAVSVVACGREKGVLFATVLTEFGDNDLRQKTLDWLQAEGMVSERASLLDRRLVTYAYDDEGTSFRERETAYYAITGEQLAATLPLEAENQLVQPGTVPAEALDAARTAAARGVVLRVPISEVAPVFLPPTTEAGCPETIFFRSDRTYAIENLGGVYGWMELDKSALSSLKAVDLSGNAVRATSFSLGVHLADGRWRFRFFRDGGEPLSLEMRDQKAVENFIRFLKTVKKAAESVGSHQICTDGTPLGAVTLGDLDAQALSDNKSGSSGPVRVLLRFSQSGRDVAVLSAPSGDLRYLWNHVEIALDRYKINKKAVQKFLGERDQLMQKTK